MSDSNHVEEDLTERPHFWHPDGNSHLAEGTATLVERPDEQRTQMRPPSTVPMEEEEEQIDTKPPFVVGERVVEMLAILTYVCSRCHRKITTYHEVTSAEQLQKMCPQCNSVGYSLERQIRGTYRNEFAVEFVLVPHGAVEYDDTGDVRLPFDRRQERAIFRSLVKVRKKYPLFGKTLIIQTKLDPGDRELQGMDVIIVYLLRHEQRIAWTDLRKNPTPALDGNHSPFNTSFEYHPS
jgi:DNA-directed RNA polymerase subunit RPC12/RpoP